MNKVLLINLLAIGVTAYYMSNNKDRISNWLAGFLIASISLSFLRDMDINTYSYLAYFLTTVAALFFVITNKTITNQRTLLIIFLTGILIKSLPYLFHLPYVWIYFAIAAGATGIYIYFQLNRSSTRVLVLTTIPVADCILTLSSLVE